MRRSASVHEKCTSDEHAFAPQAGCFGRSSGGASGGGASEGWLGRFWRVICCVPQRPEAAEAERLLPPQREIWSDYNKGPPPLKFAAPATPGINPVRAAEIEMA
jgi:hypothetical protein